MAFHVDVEAEIFEGLWDISDPPEDDIYSQVSPDESEQEIPADVSTPHPPDSQAPGHKVPSKFARLFSNSRRWTISAAEFCCKVLVPAYSAGAVIGKRGKNLMKLQQRTQTMMTVSATHVFFPGTRDRMLIILAATKRSFAAGVHAVVTEAMKRSPDQAAIQLVVPSSSAGKIMGQGGANICEIRKATGCHISMSPQNRGVNERVVLLKACTDIFLVRGAVSVLECIQDDPQIQEHMSFKYVVALPLGSWDCGKPGPAEPSVELMPLELARVSPKRPILENLLRAAPRKLLIRHGVLGGSIEKVLKRTTREELLAVLAEAWGSIPKQNGRADSPNEGLASGALRQALPVGLQP
ncbi:NOVA2 [Symbiodinium natans]|uniref:NOVA2 protein n=1 Tax=Symbiodinium natans TaxID=878477 RepID=A0A812TJ12_9DINO|nr:NOVA2 [Symbiodinium natans]